MSSEQKTDKNKALNRKLQYQLFDLSKDEEINSLPSPQQIDGVFVQGEGWKLDGE
ncbi:MULTISPECIES: hypothetical protein [Priestia]|jgi:hypothetical protein|uniref:hypothetical protein n=1 Tax=Priestia TaxID=2800373 RepID=UPI00203C54B2|nr:MULTISPECIES: hypothetical protein [Priestia]MCM3771891.1 hypothetical protein [Priestia aryabhattai]MDY0940171.1 hypothetical protein [Priestia megaterium]